jgi:SAM-dependent methyltransferase
MDLPRYYTIREVNNRVINPFSEEKLADLGRRLHLLPGWTVLDLASGKGELLGTWARDHGITGTGVDISTVNRDLAEARAAELGVADRVRFIHGDAGGYVADEPVDVACCVGATWIGGGTAGTMALLDRSLRPGGLMLIGEIYWRVMPPDQATVTGCHLESVDDARALPDLVASFGDLGWDLVEMVLANEDTWDRYEAGHWLAMRRWLDAHPDDELAPQLRVELDTVPVQHVIYRRNYLGWGVFALLKR